MKRLPSNMRATEQRRVLLEVLRGLKTHPTADELYILVKQRLPRISLATVYRNLELMAEQGLVRKVVLGDGPMRFDGTMEPHEHIRCMACGRVADVAPVVSEERYEDVEDETGFEVYGHQVAFFGLCPECRKRASRRRKH